MQIQHTYTPDLQIIHVYFTVELCSVLLCCVVQTFLGVWTFVQTKIFCSQARLSDIKQTVRYLFFLWKPFLYISRFFFFGVNMLNVVCLKGNVEFVCDKKIQMRPFYANTSWPHPALYIYYVFLCLSSL